MRVSFTCFLPTGLFLLISCSPERPSSSIWSETLHQAKAVGFDYEDHVVAAKNSDIHAIRLLLIFSSEIDAAGGLGHGVVLAELLVHVGDKLFAQAASTLTSEQSKLCMIMLEAGADYSHEPPETQVTDPDLYPLTWATLSAKGDGR